MLIDKGFPVYKANQILCGSRSLSEGLLLLQELSQPKAMLCVNRNILRSSLSVVKYFFKLDSALGFFYDNGKCLGEDLHLSVFCLH